MRVKNWPYLGAAPKDLPIEQSMKFDCKTVAENGTFFGGMRST
jgi:hypothetical protein